MEDSKVTVIAALLGNLALALCKALAAAITGSAAMLAETFHSAADTGNQILLFVGLRLGQRPPDAEHPFGHGKNVYFWAFVVSVMLFSLGGAFSIWEGIHKLRTLGPTQSPAWAFGVLAAAFVFESISLGVAVRGLQRARSGRSLREYVVDNRDPTILTVALEDASALLSIVLAAGGLALAEVTGRVTWDAVASIAIGLVLVIVAVGLALENHSLLMGESAPRAVLERILAAAQRDPAVAGIEGLRTMHLGPAALLVVLDVDFRDELSAHDVESATERLREAVAEAAGEAGRRRLVVIEPRRRDIGSPARAA